MNIKITIDSNINSSILEKTYSRSRIFRGSEKKGTEVGFLLSFAFK